LSLPGRRLRRCIGYQISHYPRAEFAQQSCWRPHFRDLDNGCMLVSNMPRGDPMRGAACMPLSIEFS
jgi:hypothetical protein